jgi:hypothetical protein
LRGLPEFVFVRLAQPGGAHDARLVRGLAGNARAGGCLHSAGELGSFSEAQTVMEPRLLADVFALLSHEVTERGPPLRPSERHWLVQDGSLFDALPRMHWALWRRQAGQPRAQVRLHLTLALAGEQSVRAAVTPGKTCERAVWRTQWQRGDAFIGDRYYAEDYRMFWLLEERGVAFVVRCATRVSYRRTQVSRPYFTPHP